METDARLETEIAAARAKSRMLKKTTVALSLAVVILLVMNVWATVADAPWELGLSPLCKAALDWRNRAPSAKAIEEVDRQCGTASTAPSTPTAAPAAPAAQPPTPAPPSGTPLQRWRERQRQLQRAGAAVTVTMGDGPSYGFNPKRIEVAEGTVIKLVAAKEFHTFTVKDLGIDQIMAAGANAEVKVPTGKKGTFKLVCLPHESLGMVGEVVVK